MMIESPAGLVRGLFEAHLHVANLERTMGFYGDVLGFELGLKETERRAVFYWLGKNHSTMLGIWERPPWAGRGIRKPVRQHLAFEVCFDDLRAAIDRLKQRGIGVKNFYDQVTDEPSVFGWIPAAAIYFNDPDGHLLEFIARLDDLPAPERGIVPLAEWKSR